VFSVLTTDQKGSIAEQEIVCAAMKLGIGVFAPRTDGERYDLIFDVRPQLIRVRCKWAPRHGDVIVLRCYSARRNSDGLLRRPYGRGEFDAYAAYCPEVDRCYFVPYSAFPGRVQVQLRLGATRNNQQAGVNWAKDFEFAATLGHLGAVAQLGERESGRLEVTGSSPVGSTSEFRDLPKLSELDPIHSPPRPVAVFREKPTGR
jgi:PD-(D/E)XK endonuclease